MVLEGLTATGAVEQVPFKAVFQAMMIGEPSTRVAATRVMGLLGERADPQVMAYLADFLRMDWPEVLGPAAEALGRLSPHFPEAAEELHQAARDVDDTVSEVHVWLDALEIAAGRDGSDGVLLDGIKERVRSSLPAAAAALAWLGSKAGDVGDLWLEVENARPHSPPVDVINTVITISRRNAAVRLPASVRLHDHGSPLQRLRIRGATAGTLRSLLAGLTADEKLRRDAAFAALSALGGNIEPLILDLVGLLASSPLETRAAAARLLGGCGAQARSAVPALRPLLSARETELRVAAWDALRRILDTNGVFRAASGPERR